MNKLIISTKIVFCLILMFYYNTAKAQQLSYTQYMYNQTPINSAFSLIQPGGVINTTVRKQWIGVPGAPTTYIFNGNIPVESINSSVGLIAISDVLAVERSTELNAFFAKGIRLNENQSLGVSLNAGFRNYIATYSGIDSADPAFRNDVREIKPNLGFAVMFYSHQYYLGVSAPELNIRSLGNASRQDDSNFRNHYYFSAGVGTELYNGFKFKYSGLLSYSSGLPLIGDISCIATIPQQTFGIGVNYRTNKEMAGIISINFDSFHLGYSYQFGISSSNIGEFNNATQELNLSFHFGKKK